MRDMRVRKRTGSLVHQPCCAPRILAGDGAVNVFFRCRRRADFGIASPMRAGHGRRLSCARISGRAAVLRMVVALLPTGAGLLWERAPHVRSSCLHGWRRAIESPRHGLVRSGQIVIRVGSLISGENRRPHRGIPHSGRSSRAPYSPHNIDAYIQRMLRPRQQHAVDGADVAVIAAPGDGDVAV